MSHPPALVGDRGRALVLGSTSRYRRELLERLRIPFIVESPDVDETPLSGESPRELALRLALAKARAVARRHPQAVVIGSDQVADLHGEPLGKPGTHERALGQLRRMRGQSVVFQTAVAVVCDATGFEQLELGPAELRLARRLVAGVWQRFDQVPRNIVNLHVSFNPLIHGHFARAGRVFAASFIIRCVAAKRKA